MKYHKIINGYSNEWKIQIQELSGFCRQSLPSMEQGESFLICKTRERAEEIKNYLSGDIILIQSEMYLAEDILKELCPLVEEEDLYVFGSDYCGTELAVRVAARKKGGSAVSVHDFMMEERAFIKKMVYANHMEATFQMKRKPYCISIAKGMCQEALIEEKGHFIKEIICPVSSEFVASRELKEAESSKGLEEARIAVIAGRGAKNKEQVQKLEEIAVSMNGVLGISRPAAMNAWAPMHSLVGVSGAMIHPELCITAGVSGSAAFYAGIAKSKFIVAINTDEKAPIMKKADVAIVDNFVPVMQELKRILEEQMIGG